MFNPDKVKKGTRYSYARIKEVMEMPHLLDIQRNSYKWFLEEGLKEILEDISPISIATGNLKLFFKDPVLGKPKYSLDECKERDSTYSAPIRVKVQLVNHELGDVKEQEVFMGDFPLMTETGTFIINGAERVIVSQLVRSPGVYYDQTFDQTGKKIFTATLIPNRGAWIELETEPGDKIRVRIDRTRKMPVTYFLRALGFENDNDILALFDFNPFIKAELDRDETEMKSQARALEEVYKHIRPNEPTTSVDNALQLLNSLFFDPKRYDLAPVGRFKLSKKLGLKSRLIGKTLAEDIVDPDTGEIIFPANKTVSEQDFLKFFGAPRLLLGYSLAEDFTVDGNIILPKNTLITNDNIESILKFQRWQVILNQDAIDNLSGEVLVTAGNPINDLVVAKIDSNKEKAIFNLMTDQDNKGIINPIPFKIMSEDAQLTCLCTPTQANRTISISDIVAAIGYLLDLMKGVGNIDDIDHLGNRRVRSVGELLQNQFRIGLARMERVVRDRMTTQDADFITPQLLINIKPVIAAIKEFFGSSQLSQFMDQHNPLSELTHKRRLSALGPGGLSRERAGFEVRDVHNSHYGRMCPIETPEGPNIGLIGSLANFAKIDQFGFVQTPYRKVSNNHVTNDVRYMPADEEERHVIAQANEPLDENDCFINERVTARHMQETSLVPRESVDFMDVSPKQVVSIATALIPFLENDDANRALMGANMQRQAVPLLRTQAPFVGTGMEKIAAADSGVMILAKNSGTVTAVDANSITIDAVNYKLQKFQRSNQGTCINQIPIVQVGQYVEKGQPIADGPATSNGELALGFNIIVAYMPWEGFNYEDAILISENLLKRDIFTSIHIEEHLSDARDTKLGPEDLTRDIPNVADDALANLDAEGIVAVGSDVRPGDILVGKVTPKGETELTAEERLLRAIFGEKAREVRDTSLRVPHGQSGKVVAVKTFTRENNDELPPGVNKQVRVYIAQKRKISVGDKMSGRHGNKGVVSHILRQEDMPFLADGTPVDIVLNPLGVPSRMNIGQILETHLGFAVSKLGFSIATPVFDGAKESDIIQTMEAAKVPVTGKSVLYDGRTGLPFENDVTVGCVYMLKLHHLVDDKIHARSTGPYSLVTQQPLGGKAQFGGQRFGEMEVWALEAYGASYTLQEILTVKSDDVVGRVKAYEAIVKGNNIPEPGVPESFKVLIKELQSIGLDISVLTSDSKEIDIRDEEDDAPRRNQDVPPPPDPEPEPNEPIESPEPDDFNENDYIPTDEEIAELEYKNNPEDLGDYEDDFNNAFDAFFNQNENYDD